MEYKDFINIYYVLVSILLFFGYTLTLLSDKVILLNNSIPITNSYTVMIPFYYYIIAIPFIIIIILRFVIYCISIVKLTKAQEELLVGKMILCTKKNSTSKEYCFYSYLLVFGIPLLLILICCYFAMKTHKFYIIIFYLIILSYFIHLVVLVLEEKKYLYIFIPCLLLISVICFLSSIGKFEKSNIKIIGDSKLVNKRIDYNNNNYKDFEFIQLENAILIENTFIKCNFNFSNLKGVDFSKSIFCDSFPLNRSSFIEAELSDANFANANLINCDFTNATLKNCSFRRSNLELSNFTGCDLRDIKDLTIIQLNNVNLKDCLLPEFVLDSIKNNYKEFRLLIDSNKHYNELKKSLQSIN